MSKPPAKASTATKTAAKPAAKAAPAAASKTAPPPVAKAPAKAPVKTAAKPPSKPTNAPNSAPTTAPAKAAPAAPAVAAVKTPVAPKPGRGGKVSLGSMVHPTSPPSNRFTDRFAPARPNKHPDPIEVQKSSFKADPRLVNAWKSKPGRELTEPELLAMPDAEYMNDKQLDFFRARLQQQKDDLLSNAGETTEHLREDTSIVPDPADRATIEEEHALELRTRDRERKLLKKIAQSLARLDSGDYGFCDETGEPIGLARLLARPTATLSLEAQQRRELKQKMFGD